MAQSDGLVNYETIETGILGIVNTYVIPALMTVATVVLVIMGIVTGINMAKASTEEEKSKAKKNLIGILLGAAVCIASIWLIPLIIDLLVAEFGLTGNYVS